MYLCISPPYFFCSSVGFGKWHTSSASKSTEIARSAGCPPSPPPGHTQQLTSLLQCRAPKRFFETHTNKKEQVADMWWMDYQNVHKKRCSYSGCVWGKGATRPEDWTAAPFSPPGLLLLPCINTRCPPKKTAIQLEPHVQWLSYDLVPRLAHHHHISSTTTWRGPGTAPHAPVVIRWIHHQRRRRAAARTDRYSPTSNLQTQSQLIRFKKGQTVWHILQKPSLFF